MGWDSSRPVPWQRLIREWLVYAVVMTGVFVIFFRGGSAAGAVAGVLISGPLYLGLGAVLAKFGYQRQRLRRPERDSPGATPASKSTAGSDARPKPAPTSRTGGQRRPPSSKGRR
jgi:hypothetical protein